MPRVREDFGYPPAGYAHQPDRRHAGRAERPVRRALQDGPQGVQGHAARRIRHACPATVNEEVRAQGDWHQARGCHHLPPRRPDLEPELPKYREETKDLATSEEDVLSLRAVPAGRTQVHQPPQPAHAEAAPHDGSHRAPRSERARRRAVLPQVNRNEKSPFHLGGRFSYFVRSSCICTCGMPSSKNSSDVGRRSRSPRTVFFTYVCASIVILSARSFSVAASMAAATILLPQAAAPLHGDHAADGHLGGTSRRAAERAHRPRYRPRPAARRDARYAVRVVDLLIAALLLHNEDRHRAAS